MKKNVTNKQILAVRDFLLSCTKATVSKPLFFGQLRLALVFTVFVLASYSAKSQEHVFAWATSVGGTGGDNLDEGKAIALDAQGNVYSTGLFRITADFDPGSGIHNLTSAGGNDIFVQKLDANGNFVWAKQIGGSGAETGRAIATDAAGNVYIAGPFNGPVDFGAGTVTPVGDNDIFILKLSANDGSFIWVKTMGGSGSDDAKSITTDVSGDVYIAGQFNGNVDFGSGTSVSSEGNDIFVLKLAASGAFGWVKTIGSSGSDIAYGITTDASGNIYTTGQFNGTVDFGSGTGITSSGGNDIFVLKLDTDGNFGWVKSMGGSGSDIGYGIAADASNIYITGQFNGAADFGTTSLTSAGNNDIVIQKLTTSGDVTWAKGMGGSGSDIGYFISVDASGNVYTIGAFNGTASFGSASLTAMASNSDTFIQKLNSSGSSIWVKGIHDSFGGVGLGIAVDDAGNIHATGSFGVTTDFDPGTGTFNLVAGSSRDIFVLKWKPETAASVVFSNFTVTSLGGRLSLNWQTSIETNNKHFEVEVSKDGINYTKVGTVDTKATGGNSNTNLSYEFSLDTKSSGFLLGTSVLSLALIGLLFNRKNKWLFTLFIIGSISVLGASSCSKKDPKGEDEVPNTPGGKQQVFVRIKQVSNDNSFKFSDIKIVEVDK